MIYKKRIISSKLSLLTSHFSVVVVSGARQVGKSTLIEHLFPNWSKVLFEPMMDVGNARADPELFLNNHPCPLILDEIQYAPELLPGIKRRVDQNKKPGMYILTGSQQWTVLKSISESLAGRAVFIDLEGFALSEIAEEVIANNWMMNYLDAPEEFVHSQQVRLSLKRTLYETLWRGSLPEADTLPLDLVSDYFLSYIRTYIERDIRLLLEIYDAQQFGRFVQLVSALSAQEINYSQLGREINVTPQTSKRWLSMLRATFQWFELPSYYSNTVKRISSKPKGYFADSGLICQLNRISTYSAISGHPFAGALFESAVFSEIRKLLAPIGQKPNLYHWRSHSGSEVDIVLERDHTLYPIEIKLNSRPSPKSCLGLKSFRSTYQNKKIAPGLIICPCEKMEQITPDDYLVPWDLK